MIHFITGGERSGKSGFAQQKALECSDLPYYLATAKVWDGNFKERIDRHQKDRDNRWTTIEEQTELNSVLPNNSTVVIDCVTLWLTNLYSNNQSDKIKSLELAKKEVDQLAKYQGNLFIISNEIGMGLHGHTQSARDFVELQGWTNQYIAKLADRVTFMVSGIPMQVK